MNLQVNFIINLYVPNELSFFSRHYGISEFLLFTNTIVLYDVDHTLGNDDSLKLIPHTFPSDVVIKQPLCNSKTVHVCRSIT